jgi:hypothetical protein
MRAPTLRFSLCPLLALPALLFAQNTPHPSAASSGSRLYYYVTPRSTLETEVHATPPTNQQRFNRLKDLSNDKGCFGDQLRIQPGSGRAGSPGNLICSWSGSSTSTVVVLAEYQHEGKGESAIENWSGAGPAALSLFCDAGALP